MQLSVANSATDGETAMQPSSLKALADAVLARNKACNKLATTPQKTMQLFTDKMPSKVASDAVEDLREHVEERAAILEYDAGLPRPEAELEAVRMTATYARNAGYTWAALRAALSGYPELLASLPDKTGSVDTLPLDVSKLAVLPGKRILRQGIFTGEHVSSGNTEMNP